jgi:signal transduction histidine kinase
MRARRRPNRLESVVVQAIVLAGLAALTVAVFAVVVLGIGRVPTSGQWTLLVFSMLAAAVTALAYQPLRRRLARLATRVVRGERHSPDEVLRAFRHRLTQPLPLDELLLQLAESLRRTLPLDSAEVWTGSRGVLERIASDPDAGAGSIVLSPAEESALAGAGVRGGAWLQLWLPRLLEGRDRDSVRAIPATYAGELLGLIVVERRAGEGTDDDDRVLIELAPQVGLALHNVRLGAALRASHDELERQADALRASRARVVTAADAERRRIERDLHDGAQQHLVSLAVNLRLARELAESDPAEARAVLDELGVEVQEALDEFRDLAQGIYPPLLVERGLGEGLRSGVARTPVPVQLDARGLCRYPPEVETTLYFCCLEAVQNVGKHAGTGARASVRVWEDEDGVLFEVRDDGSGFDPAADSRGSGLTNMSDRLGALGGRLSVDSSPARGTRIRGVIPLSRPPRRGREAPPSRAG